MAWRNAGITSKGYHLTVVVLGLAGVGKSSIVSRLIGNSFRDEYEPTVEKFYKKDAKIKNVTISLNVIDTAGDHDSFRRELSIAYGDAFILVYDLTKAESFAEICRIRDDVIKVKGNNCHCVIIGNKTDMNVRHIDQGLAENIVKFDLGHAYMETSAKDNLNVKSIFQKLFQHAGMIKRKKDENSRISLLAKVKTHMKVLYKKKNSCVISL